MAWSLIECRPLTPEQRARDQIDAQRHAAGWLVQDAGAANLATGRGIALREFPLARGYGTADYPLYVDRRALGVREVKKEGATLTRVEVQTERYGKGLPPGLPAWQRPLPFLYESAGVEIGAVQWPGRRAAVSYGRQVDPPRRTFSIPRGDHWSFEVEPRVRHKPVAFDPDCQERGGSLEAAQVRDRVDAALEAAQLPLGDS